MFAYLRYFAVISFVVVVAAAIMVGMYFRSMASDDLLDIVEKNNVALAQGFINTTWQKHLPNIRRLSAIDINLWGKYREFRKFSEDTFRHFEGAPVTQINIYTKNGERVLSVHQNADITYASSSTMHAMPKDEQAQLQFDQAKGGAASSRILERTQFTTLGGANVEGTVVRTFVPILSDSFVSILHGSAAEVEGIMEIYFDITPQWEQIYLFQTVGTGGILFIFMLVLGALFFTSRRAEAIIGTQHEANVELASAAARAEAESRQKSQFLANVSHELRTPLNAIIGFSEIIKNGVMGPLGNDQYMNYIRDIHSSGVHLLSLINDILDFSKAEAGKLELHLSEIDATKLIKNCMRLVSPRAEQSGVNLVTELPKEHFVLNTDAKKLKQVLLNLLSNSVKFTPQGGEVKITAWQNIVDDSIAIEVKDSGIGIAPKDISRAMSPFGQVDSKLSRKYEGTGLGLPLSKKFVELMGGTFRLESELNVGTTITISIPLNPPASVLKAIAKSSHEGPAVATPASEEAPDASTHQHATAPTTSFKPQESVIALGSAVTPQPPSTPTAAPSVSHASLPAHGLDVPESFLTPPKPVAPTVPSQAAPSPSSQEMDMTPSQAPLSEQAPDSAAPQRLFEIPAAPPAPATSESSSAPASGSTTFASYEDLKKMQQQKSAPSSPATTAPQEETSHTTAPLPTVEDSGNQPMFTSYADLKRLQKEGKLPNAGNQSRASGSTTTNPLTNAPPLKDQTGF